MDRFLIRAPKKARTDDGPPSQCPSCVVSWNANSLRLRADRGQLKAAVQSFLARGADAIMLQETRVKPEDKGQCETALRAAGLKDWSFYWGMHGGCKRYSGTALAVAPSCKPLSVRYRLNDLGARQEVGTYRGKGTQGWEDPEIEGRLVVAEYPQCWLVCVYTPNCSWFGPNRIRREDWDTRFAAMIQGLLPKTQQSAPPLTSDNQRPACNGMGRIDSSRPALPGLPMILVGDLNVCHTSLDVSHPDFFATAMKPATIGAADPGLVGQPGYTEEERERFGRLLLDGCQLVDTFRELHPGDRRLTWGWAANFEVGRYQGKYMGLDYALVSRSLWSAGVVKESIILGNSEAGCHGSDHVPILVRLDWTQWKGLPGGGQGLVGPSQGEGMIFAGEKTEASGRSEGGTGGEYARNASGQDTGSTVDEENQTAGVGSKVVAG